MEDRTGSADRVDRGDGPEPGDGPADGLDASERDALLTEWESLQSGIREYKNQYHRRIVRGTVVLAAVAGYAVETDTGWLLMFIPIIVGLIFTVHVQEANNVYYRTWQSYLVEEEVDVEAFDWTERFAGLTRPNELVPEGDAFTRYDVSWRLSPSAVAYGIGAMVYGGFAVHSAVTVLPEAANGQYDPVVGLPFEVWGVAFYGLFTVVLVVVGYTHWRIRIRFKEEVLDEETEGDPPREPDGESTEEPDGESTGANGRFRSVVDALRGRLPP